MTIAVGYSEQFGILLSEVNALEAKLGKVGNWKGFSWINIFKMVRFNSTVTRVSALPMKQNQGM